MSAAIAIVLLGTGALAESKGDSGSGGGSNGKYGGLGFAGVGVDGPKVTSPGAGMSIDGLGFFLIGFDIPLFHQTRVNLVGGIGSGIGSGKFDYDYTSKSNVHYQETGKKTYMQTTEAFGGLQFRLINASWFHVYAEGGATYGSDYQKSDENITLTGEFAESGIDLLVGRFGLRFAGRYARHYTDKIPTLANKKAAWQGGAAYVAIVAYE